MIKYLFSITAGIFMGVVLSPLLAQVTEDTTGLPIPAVIRETEVSLADIKYASSTEADIFIKENYNNTMILSKKLDRVILLLERINRK